MMQVTAGEARTSSKYYRRGEYDVFGVEESNDAPETPFVLNWHEYTYTEDCDWLPLFGQPRKSGPVFYGVRGGDNSIRVVIYVNGYLQFTARLGKDLTAAGNRWRLLSSDIDMQDGRYKEQPTYASPEAFIQWFTDEFYPLPLPAGVSSDIAVPELA